MTKLIILFLALFFSSNLFSFEVKTQKINMNDLMVLLDLKVIKYQFDLPATEPSTGYGLTIYIEKYDGALNKTYKLEQLHLGLGYLSQPNLLIRYPGNLENETKNSYILFSTDVNTTKTHYYRDESREGAIIWYIEDNLKLEINREFILALRVQGYDDLVKTSDDLAIKLNEMKKIGVDSVYVIKGLIKKFEK